MSSARRMTMLGRMGGSCGAAETPVSRDSVSRRMRMEFRKFNSESGLRVPTIRAALLEGFERRLVLRPPRAPGLRRAVRLVRDLVERFVDRGNQLLGALGRTLVASDR